MIEAIVFDLDGTLVQTERLKAVSYAQAAIELCPRDLDQQQVIEAFKQVVGRSRREVAQELVRRFDLAEKAAARAPEFGVSEPWQAYIQVRLQHYGRLLEDASLVREHRCTDNLDVLEFARQRDLRTGLATMSRCGQAVRMLELLGLSNSFDFVATRDDVEHGKPDPEIYTLVIHTLGVAPQDCLVLEDSASGVQAALEAGTHCIAVTSEFTRLGVHELGRLDPRWIVDDGAAALTVVQQLLSDQEAG